MQKITFISIYQAVSIALLDGGKHNASLLLHKMVQSVSLIGKNAQWHFQASEASWRRFEFMKQKSKRKAVL